METKNAAGYSAEVEIGLLELWTLFRKNFWRIAAAALLSAVIVGVVCKLFVAPTYKATAKLYVVSASNDSVANLNDLQIGTKLAADFQDLLLTDQVMEEIIQDLGLDVSPNSLKRQIDIENPPDTRILNIAVITDSAQLSADIANEVADKAVSWLPAVMESNAPNIAQRASVPTQKSGPRTTRNAFLGAVMAALLMYAFYVVRHLLDDSVATAEDMERYFGTPPLSSVPIETDNKKRKTRPAAKKKGKDGKK